MVIWQCCCVDQVLTGCYLLDAQQYFQRAWATLYFILNHHGLLSALGKKSGETTSVGEIVSSTDSRRRSWGQSNNFIGRHSVLWLKRWVPRMRKKTNKNTNNKSCVAFYRRRNKKKPLTEGHKKKGMYKWKNIIWELGRLTIINSP